MFQPAIPILDTPSTSENKPIRTRGSRHLACVPDGALQKHLVCSWLHCSLATMPIIPYRQGSTIDLIRRNKSRRGLPSG